MNLKKFLVFFLGAALFLSLNVSVQAASVPFNLNLSNLNGNSGISGLTDVTGIEFISFFGSAELSVDSPSPGDFTESGSISLVYYNDAQTPLVTSPAELQIGFTNLAGTYAGDFITFNSGQTLTMKYVDPSSSLDLDIAVFDLNPGSGGQIMSGGLYIPQHYYLTLNSDTYGIFGGSPAPTDFESLLVAGSFFGSDYLITGQVSAVPVPASLMLLCSGLICLLGLKRKNIS